VDPAAVPLSVAAVSDGSPAVLSAGGATAAIRFWSGDFHRRPFGDAAAPSGDAFAKAFGAAASVSLGGAAAAAVVPDRSDAGVLAGASAVAPAEFSPAAGVDSVDPAVVPLSVAAVSDASPAVFGAGGATAAIRFWSGDFHRRPFGDAAALSGAALAKAFGAAASVSLGGAAAADVAPCGWSPAVESPPALVDWSSAPVVVGAGGRFWS
jgi:hypothetical protein